MKSKLHLLIIKYLYIIFRINNKLHLDQIRINHFLIHNKEIHSKKIYNKLIKGKIKYKFNNQILIIKIQVI